MTEPKKRATHTAVDLHLIETSEEQQMLVDNLTTWARDVIWPHIQEWDEEQELPAQVLQGAEEQGLYMISLSESLGGLEMGFQAALAAVEVLAQFEPSLALKVALINGPIASLWPDDLDLADATWGVGQLQVDQRGATGHLSDVPWGESARWILLPQGDRLYTINLESERVTRRSQRDRLGLRCAEWVELQFDGAPTTAYPLRRRDRLRAQAWMNLGWAAIAIGAGKAGLEEGIKYASERVQFKRPISDFQAIQWMIADSLTELDAARLLTYEAARALESGEAWDVREGARLAAQARLLAAEAGHHACDRGLQMHGGYGFTREYPVERFWRDVQRTYPTEGRDGLDQVIINGLNAD
jgi:hypothetical protein